MDTQGIIRIKRKLKSLLWGMLKDPRHWIPCFAFLLLFAVFPGLFQTSFLWVVVILVSSFVRRRLLTIAFDADGFVLSDDRLLKETWQFDDIVSLKETRRGLVMKTVNFQTIRIFNGGISPEEWRSVVGLFESRIPESAHS